MAERPTFGSLAWDTETKKLETIQPGEAEPDTLAAYKEARKNMGHIRRKINVINDELEEASKNAQKEVEQLSFTSLAYDDLMHTIKTKTKKENGRETNIWTLSMGHRNQKTGDNTTRRSRTRYTACIQRGKKKYGPHKKKDKCYK